MTADRGAVLAAVAAVTGALHPWSPGLGAGAAVAAVALLGRRPALLCIVVGLATSGLAQRSLDGLDGVREASVSAEVTLLTDPTPSFGGLRVDVRLGHRRLEARANGASAVALGPALAGEVVRVHGAVAPAGDRPWLVARHVSGRLTVWQVERVDEGTALARAANGLRRILAEGARPLDDRQRSLFAGLVIGDDRNQPPELADAFLGAGLTHLLAVSGQNVAFVLAMAGPVLRRLRLWPRLLATLPLVAFFGVMTRFEPSVLRASAMAMLAATLATAARPVPRVRVLAWAMCTLVLVDPLLVRSVGFQLSASAALAIVVVAPRLAPVLPGPAALREALAVTLAAQLGVAPVLLSSFGPIPVASLPANLLAVPVAGWVMIWGLTGGLLAGILGGVVASAVHTPTRFALSWLELVAARGSSAPLGELGRWHVAALAVGLGLVVASRTTSRHIRTGWAVAVVALALPVAVAHAPPPLRSGLGVGVVRWHATGTDVVVLGGVGGRTTLQPSNVLEALRRDGVEHIDLLVVADSSVPEAVVLAVRRAHRTGAMLAEGVALGGVAAIGALDVRVTAVPDRLVVECVPRAA